MLYTNRSALNPRRIAASLTLVGIASLSVVALYQTGVLKRLPEPKVPLLDAESVNGSSEAYAILGIPDAILGIGSYVTTLGLISMGGPERAKTHPFVPLALVAKCTLDSVQAAYMTQKSWLTFRAFSFYSLITVVCTFLVLPLTFSEARKALHIFITKNKI